MESSKKWHTCDRCSKKLSSYHSLWRHKKNCGSHPSYNVAAVSAIRGRSPLLSRSPDISTLNARVEKRSGSTNPKIQSLLDEIINDSSTDKSPPQAITKKISSIISQNTVPPNPSLGIVAEVYPSKISAKVIPNPSTEVVSAVFQEKPELIIDEIMLPLVKSKPRTKGDIIGFSDGERSEEESSDDADESSTDSDESIDISNIKPKVKFLPASIEGLCKRFRTLWAAFTREGKHEHRNEIVFLLDELLRQEAITRDDYRKLVGQ